MSNPARRRYKAKYYKKHRKYDNNANTKYTDEECWLILNSTSTDVDLTRLLCRSLMAIQCKRVRLSRAKPPTPSTLLKEAINTRYLNI